jgi:hypothetical protein
MQPATVRTICYQLLTKHRLIPSMDKAETDRVGRQLTDARFRGWIPHVWFVDETREPEGDPGWDDPAEFIATLRSAYRRNHWALQPRRVEVWSEKGTVRGTLAPVLERYGVIFRVMHGFTSTTDVFTTDASLLRSRQPLVALYVGDFDGSGMYMSEVDLPGRLDSHRKREVALDYMRARSGYADDETLLGAWHRVTPKALVELGASLLESESGRVTPVEIRRVALTLEDVLSLDLHPLPLRRRRPGKTKGDPRYPWYVRTYVPLVGRRFWELDAMDPNLLRTRVEVAIRDLIDWPTWDRSVAAEEAEVESFRNLFDAWPHRNGQP